MTNFATPLGRIPAPLAVLDLGAERANAGEMVRLAAGKPIRLASKSVRIRSRLERWLEHPGFAGILGYSVAEAIWLVRSGIHDVVVAYPSVDAHAIAAVAADPRLAREITFMIDSPQHVDFFESCVPRGSVRVGIDVDCGLAVGRVRIGVHRSPVQTPDDAVQLARRIARSHRTELVGLMFYEAQVAGVQDRGLAVRAVKKASNAQLDQRRGAIVAAVRAVTDLEFVNGGGTGSLHTTAADSSITELAGGSGLFAPHAFDSYDGVSLRPAAYFVSPVVRKPRPDVVVTFSGGYSASGPAGASRQPQPVSPRGLQFFRNEAAGEVQTPLHGEAARALEIGDLVWFRHAKAGEMCERFDEVVLIEDGAVIDRVPTYRGEGQNFG